MSSELLGVIVEGGMTFITVGTAQNYVLEPMRYSLDPDVDETDPQVSVLWFFTLEIIFLLGIAYQTDEKECKAIQKVRCSLEMMKNYFAFRLRLGRSVK